MSKIDLNRLSEVIAAAANTSRPLEEEDKYSAQELQEAVAEMVSDEGPAQAGQTIAEVIYKRIRDEARFLDLTGTLMPHGGTYAIGDGPLYERWGEPVLYWLGDENTHMNLLSTKVTKENFTAEFASIYARFDFNVDLLAAGKYGDLGLHINKARKHFVGAGNMLMWKALQAAVPSGSGYTTGALTFTGMSDMSDFVEDESDEGCGAFFGRRTSLSAMSNWLSSAGPVDDNKLFSDNMKDKVWNERTLRQLRGVPVVPLPKQKVNASPTKILNAGFSGIDAIPKGDIMCIPQDYIGEFVEQGPLEVVRSTDAGSRTYTYTMGRRMGVVIFDPDKIARHVITS